MTKPPYKQKSDSDHFRGQVSFLKPVFLSDAGMELTCFWTQMKAENMKFSKLVLLSPIGAFNPEILASQVKIAFFLGHPVGAVKLI